MTVINIIHTRSRYFQDTIYVLIGQVVIQDTVVLYL